MKLTFLTLLIIACYILNVNAGCIEVNTADFNLDYELEMCPEFNGVSGRCCNATNDARIKSNMASARILLGSASCYQNYLRFLCAWTCDPQQDSFVTFERGTNNREIYHIYITRNVSDPLYDSCKQECPSLLARTYEELYADSIDFIGGALDPDRYGMNSVPKTWFYLNETIGLNHVDFVAPGPPSQTRACAKTSSGSLVSLHGLLTIYLIMICIFNYN